MAQVLEEKEHIGEVTKPVEDKPYVDSDKVNFDQAILTLEPLSDTFSLKVLSLKHGSSIKIGRKTNPKQPPEPSNGVFDAKVLSRTHAEFMFENNKVFIRDLRSSNGTFLNGTRLSEEGVMSSPFELHNGDLLEFGIDIIEDEGKGVMYRKVSAKVSVDYKATANDARRDMILSHDSVKEETSISELLTMMDDESTMSNEVSSMLKQIRTSFDVIESHYAIPKGSTINNATLSQSLSNTRRPSISSRRPTIQAQPKLPSVLEMSSQMSRFSDDVTSLKGQITDLSSSFDKNLKSNKQVAAEEKSNELQEAINQIRTDLEAQKTEIAKIVKSNAKVVDFGTSNSLDDLSLRLSESERVLLAKTDDLERVLSSLQSQTEQFYVFQDKLSNQLLVLEKKTEDFITQIERKSSAKFNKDLESVSVQLSVVLEKVSLLESSVEKLDTVVNPPPPAVIDTIEKEVAEIKAPVVQLNAIRKQWSVLYNFWIVFIAGTALAMLMIPLISILNESSSDTPLF